MKRSVINPLSPSILPINIGPLQGYKATTAAMRASSLPLQEMDWRILMVINEAEKPVSFYYLFGQFSKGNPNNTLRYGRYYESINRLLASGLLSQSYAGRYRRWSITPAGRIEIERLNQRALEYLKMQDQGGE